MKKPVLLFLVALSSCFKAGYPLLSHFEFNALHDLYLTTGGQNWLWDESTNKTVWNFTSAVAYDPCSQDGFGWQGKLFLVYQE